MTRDEELRIHALGGAISRRSWGDVEAAHAAIRDAAHMKGRGELGRDIVQWLGFEAPHYGSKLHLHLRRLGRPAPAWLSDLIPDVDHTPPKGAVALAIAKAVEVGA